MTKYDFCEGCAFYTPSLNICNYLLMMDVRRGCPGGEGCDKKMTKGEFFAMGMQKDWNKTAGKSMWEAGHGDAEIAKAMGVTQGTISYFRRKHWEPERDAAAADDPIIEDLAAENEPIHEDIPAEEPVCVPDLHSEAEQKTPIQKDLCRANVSPSREGPGISRAEKKTEPDHQQLLFRALEDATGNLTGMDAVVTAQIITDLWRWTDKAALMKVKASLDYLIRRHDHGNTETTADV